MEKRKVKHVDGITDVIAKGRIINGEFVGEYKFQGMTYGVTVSAVDIKTTQKLNVKPDFLKRVDNFMIKRVKNL